MQPWRNGWFEQFLFHHDVTICNQYRFAVTHKYIGTVMLWSTQRCQNLIQPTRSTTPKMRESFHSCFVSFPFPNSSSKSRSKFSKNSFQTENFLEVQVDQTACPLVKSNILNPWIIRKVHPCCLVKRGLPQKNSLKNHPQIQRLEFPWWQIFQTSAPQHPADLQDAHDAVQFSLDEGHKRAVLWGPRLGRVSRYEKTIAGPRGTNMSNQWERRLIFPTTLRWDLLVSGREQMKWNSERTCLDFGSRLLSLQPMKKLKGQWEEFLSLTVVPQRS